LSEFATQFAKISQANTKVAFETRFQSIQNGLLKRLNKQIDGIINDDTTRRLEAFQKERDKLTKLVEQVRDYQIGLQTNAFRFVEIQETSEAAAVAADADGNATLSAAEVSALNTSKESISENVRHLQKLYYPGFFDGNLVLRIGQDADTLDGLTAVTGTVDPAGTTTPTNDNRTLIDALNTLANQATTFAGSTNTLVEATNKFIIDAQKKLISLDANVTEITAVEVARKNQEIEELKAQHANILKAISISFEVSSGLADSLANGTKFQPEKGSILNLFT